MAAVWEHLQDPGLFGTASPWFPGKICGKRYDRGPILFRPGRDAFGGVHWLVRVSTGFLRMRQGHQKKWNGKKYKVQPKSSRCIPFVKSKPTFKSSVDSDLVWKNYSTLTLRDTQVVAHLLGFSTSGGRTRWFLAGLKLCSSCDRERSRVAQGAQVAIPGHSHLLVVVIYLLVI